MHLQCLSLVPLEAKRRGKPDPGGYSPLSPSSQRLACWAARGLGKYIQEIRLSLLRMLPGQNTRLHTHLGEEEKSLDILGDYS